MFFKNFPKIAYPVTINGVAQNVLLTDITRNIRFIKKSLESIRIYDNYSMKDGETPEIVSDLFYGTPDYHWIIMLANERYDYINDFPRSQRQLDKFVDDKYPETADTVAYWTKNNKVVDYNTIGAIGITNRNHETIVNEAKRTIKIIPKDYISIIVKDFIASINE